MIAPVLDCSSVCSLLLVLLPGLMSWALYFMNLLQYYNAFFALVFFSPARQQAQPVHQNGQLQRSKELQGSMSPKVHDGFYGNQLQQRG